MRLVRNAIAAEKELRKTDSAFSIDSEDLINRALFIPTSLRSYATQHSARCDAFGLVGSAQKLAWSLLQNSMFAEAVVYGREALILSLTYCGPYSLEVAGSMLNLATAQILLGEQEDDESELLLRRAQAIYNAEEVKCTETECAETCFTLGLYYVDTLDFLAAEREFLKAIQYDVVVMPDEFQQTVRQWIRTLCEETTGSGGSSAVATSQ